MVTKVFLVLFSVLFLFSSYSIASEADNNTKSIFVGFNLGIEGAMGADPDTGIEPAALLLGGTIRAFFGKFGIGGTLTRATHSDDEDQPGEFESVISSQTIDIMMNISKKPKSITYIVGSFGNATEEFSGGDSSFYIEGEYNSDVWGIGIGSYGNKKNEFSFGGEIRYFNVVDSQNADGLLQLYLFLGYVF